MTSTYTVPVKVGAANQLFSLQVDTGSSDLVSSLLFPPGSHDLSHLISFLTVDRVKVVFHLKLWPSTSIRS